MITMMVNDGKEGGADDGKEGGADDGKEGGADDGWNQIYTRNQNKAKKATSKLQSRKRRFLN